MERSADSEEITETIFDATAPDRMGTHLEFYRQKRSELNSVASYETGLFQLDSLVEGFQTGELNVISGPTGNGKTLFADSISQRLMRNCKLNVAWFSYEVPTIKLVEKYIQSEDAEKIGMIVPFELKAGDVRWFKKKCVEAQMKFNCKAVFLDHIHFLVDMSSKQNMSLNIGGVIRQIKHEIAKGLNMIVFVICHQAQPKDQEPSIDNIRDSSFLGQESDNVFIVYRSPDPLPAELMGNAKIPGYQRSYEAGLATVKIDKARRAGTFRKKIAYQKQGFWLEEAL